MQDHIRRLEMHMDMMQRMQQDHDLEDDFMDPRMMFGERRNEEEVKVDLIGINVPPRALQNVPDNNLIFGSSNVALSEIIL
jgi:hypothetical protein